MKFLLPPRLRKDGVISVIAPGSPVRDPMALQQGTKFLENQGYKVQESKHLYDRQLFYAGSDDVRAAAVNRHHQRQGARA